MLGFAWIRDTQSRSGSRALHLTFQLTDRDETPGCKHNLYSKSETYVLQELTVKMELCLEAWNARIIYFAMLLLQ